MYAIAKQGWRIFGLALITAVIAANLLFHHFINILWLCNISTLLAGAALLSGQQKIAQVGASFMILGLVFWLCNIFINHSHDHWSSYLTHFSFAGAGIYIFRRQPVSRHLWIACFAWYLLSQSISRLFGPPSENINMAFDIWPGWDRYFHNYFWFWIVSSTGLLVLVFLINSILWKIQERKIEAVPRLD